MDRMRFVFSLPGKPDLDLWLPVLTSLEEVAEVEALFSLIVNAQRRKLMPLVEVEAHTGAPGKSVEIRDETERS